ncbi:MAG: cyclase [Chloroflexi bacterium]|nr:cyclase [Chloroflexota bacterium]
MALLTVLHTVRDYDAWRKTYDSAGEMQRAGGVTAESHYRLASDPNTVLVLHHFGSVAEAEAFMAQPDLRAAMEQAGVVGVPRVEVFS